MICYSTNQNKEDAVIRRSALGQGSVSSFQLSGAAKVNRSELVSANKHVKSYRFEKFVKRPKIE